MQRRANESNSNRALELDMNCSELNVNYVVYNLAMVVLSVPQ